MPVLSRVDSIVDSSRRRMIKGGPQPQLMVHVDRPNADRVELTRRSGRRRRVRRPMAHSRTAPTTNRCVRDDRTVTNEVEECGTDLIATNDATASSFTISSLPSSSSPPFVETLRDAAMAVPLSPDTGRAMVRPSCHAHAHGTTDSSTTSSRSPSPNRRKATTAVGATSTANEMATTHTHSSVNDVTIPETIPIPHSDILTQDAANSQTSETPPASFEDPATSPLEVPSSLASPTAATSDVTTTSSPCGGGAASSHHSKCAYCIKGRKGDERYHRAVAHRLAHPSCSLYDALCAGGFVYQPPAATAVIGGTRAGVAVADADVDGSAVDDEGVTLTQRKNQLSRRLRRVSMAMPLPSSSTIEPETTKALAKTSPKTKKSPWSAATAAASSHTGLLPNDPPHETKVDCAQEHDPSSHGHASGGRRRRRLDSLPREFYSDTDDHADYHSTSSSSSSWCSHHHDHKRLRTELNPPEHYPIDDSERSAQVVYHDDEHGHHDEHDHHICHHYSRDAHQFRDDFTAPMNEKTTTVNKESLGHHNSTQSTPYQEHHAQLLHFIHREQAIQHIPRIPPTTDDTAIGAPGGTTSKELSSIDTRVDLSKRAPPAEATNMSTNVSNRDDECHAENARSKLALSLFHNECRSLYSRVLLLAGYAESDAMDTNSNVYREFALRAFHQEHQRLTDAYEPKQQPEQLQQSLSTDLVWKARKGRLRSMSSAGTFDSTSEVAVPSPSPTWDVTLSPTLNVSANGQLDACAEGVDCERACPTSTNAINEPSSSVRNKSTSGVAENASCRTLVSTPNGSTDNEQENMKDESTAPPSQDSCNHCHMEGGRHIHRLEGRCGHKAILHQPQDGEAHIDFLIGDKIECYHGLHPQPYRHVCNGDNDQRTSTSLHNSPRSRVRASAHSHSETVWPSQYFCEDLFDSHHLANHSIDGASTYGGQNHPVPLPKLFDLAEIDLDSSEWNIVNEHLDGTLQGLFKLSDSGSTGTFGLPFSCDDDPSKF